MQKMRFSSKQKPIMIMEPESGVYDVLILANEEKVVEKNEQSKTAEEAETTYQYDGNIFRTFTAITESDIKSNLDYYLNVKSEEKPTEEMQEYAQSALDNYTATLIESGVI